MKMQPHGLTKKIKHRLMKPEWKHKNVAMHLALFQLAAILAVQLVKISTHTHKVIMYCIGLTGAIGSGKSTVASLFAERGIEIISADHIARQLVEKDQPALQQIVEHFGSHLLTAEGNLDRRQLRERIVLDQPARLWLENLLHPLIRTVIENQVQACKSPYSMVEIPLLTNKTDYPYLNRILLVTADENIQIARIMARDHCSQQQAAALLNTTHHLDGVRKALADDMIVNNTSLDQLQMQVEKLHEFYTCH